MRALHAIFCLTALFAGGCIRTSAVHGRVAAGQDSDPFVTVEAGNVEYPLGRLFARYSVDRASRTCWLMVGESLASMDCCDARRVGALQPVITWESDASCARQSASARPEPSPSASPPRAQDASAPPTSTEPD